ncbi:SDR family NAD(P)-dependent oxidoreductase [Mycetocola miduiensis]|uniref:NAD(P)-dependent dehydrogenase, short-chain alcohol dehydrogenase family n=1 Tax=Mycetocola miduiensis TaxID=995034 RepID=A0A1I4YM72_9MICO|nr:SDR family oxidoreductase [Mycetocola miduiensis]SFN38689.1 NAD(P)-dependent dehydrogenase, short-chain alcohol dehydrogenase family [Mycetocola miduiensis]
MKTLEFVSSRMEDRVVLVTGAGNGIGRACAIRLAQEGARVVVADLDGDAARSVAGELPRPETHLPLQLDVTSTESVNNAVSESVLHFGRLDVLVNVAGGDVGHPSFEDTDDTTWEEMLNLNLLGAMRCCRAAVAHLKASTHDPAIVTVGSVNAQIAFGSEPYSTAKAGLSALMRNLAASLAPDGIRVNTVEPATTRTRVWDPQPGGADRLRPFYPLGRVGEPADIAAAVAFLASSDAAWITGHVLPVDGGLLHASSPLGGGPGDQQRDGAAD